MHEVDGRHPPHRPRDAEHVPHVVEDRGGKREDHRIETDELVRAERPLHVGPRVAGGERGHVDTVRRE